MNRYSRLRLYTIGVVAATVAAGCGDVARQGRGPAQIAIVRLEAASGAKPAEFGGTLNSDVITMVNRTINGQQTQVPTIFNDLGRVEMRLLLKDPGQPGLPAEPSGLNQITINRYRVVYRRADGRNTPGVDVPFPFEGATTFTVPSTGTAVQAFELVRHIAKEEAPLLALRVNGILVSTIAEVWFYGRDQAGNDVTATGNMLITFGNFGDPQ